MGGFSIGGINIQTPDNITIGSGGNLTVPTGGLSNAKGNNAHIPAQNLAGAELENIVNQYNSMRAAGQNTPQVVQQLANAVNDTVNKFASVVNQVNTARARQGLADIQRLSSQVIQSFTTTTGQAVVNPLIDPNNRAVVSLSHGTGIIPGFDNSTLLLAAGAAYLLLKK